MNSLTIVQSFKQYFFHTVKRKRQRQVLDTKKKLDGIQKLLIHLFATKKKLDGIQKLLIHLFAS